MFRRTLLLRSNIKRPTCTCPDAVKNYEERVAREWAGGMLFKFFGYSFCGLTGLSVYVYFRDRNKPPTREPEPEPEPEKHLKESTDFMKKHDPMVCAVESLADALKKKSDRDEFDRLFAESEQRKQKQKNTDESFYEAFLRKGSFQFEKPEQEPIR